ncbi:hypothetical protein TYRP_009828 [Tyrophagus putrescentiae]|nr:hypothetical protein TYRP_009828 [Tyrophagus putrescentiae]
MVISPDSCRLSKLMATSRSKHWGVLKATMVLRRMVRSGKLQLHVKQRLKVLWIQHMTANRHLETPS